MREQVEKRLDFLETGEAMDKNEDVMAEVKKKFLILGHERINRRKIVCKYRKEKEEKKQKSG